jgi:RHH-type proline utilization regulon transcriptional repressor/proline dehydrogenase/delta 1-pyrroline-5-carboxylate dehydrogenase
MLEGMANHQRRALFEMTRNVLLYAPACKQEDFVHAIGYLIRRLDENTGPDNFLSHAFKLHVDSPDWQRLERQFLDSFDRIESLPDAPRRTQNRQQRVAFRDNAGTPWHRMRGEPDTDFALPQNSDWAEQLVARWRQRCDAQAAEIPLVIGGVEITEPRDQRECRDPSRPGVVVGRYRQANEHDIDAAVACAQQDEAGWRRRSHGERAEILRQVAHELRSARGELMGAALADGGKILTESDPEVSEAVDFVEFYTKTAEFWHERPGMRARGRGVVAVVSPWNFPIAIPCGGIAAALAAGNTVILKPASDTVLVAHELCQCFWRAGVPATALQMVPCSGATVGQRLVGHRAVDAVILTGGTETALQMLAAKPAMNLLAETGGKNATIVTALADRDQAIKHVLHSAFSHSGQKCSATSLLILEDEVYHDQAFRRTLCEAAASRAVGSAWDLPTSIGPLIRPPAGDLRRGLTQLEDQESWALEPRMDGEHPNLVSPAIKWGVQPGSFTHMTELFGPVLGVMRARNLSEAIQMVHATGYGLTSGLESLDDREQAIWMASVKAGNLYVNRPTTGAIVLRQPFGGMGKSSVGPGIKAGGPNYVLPLMDFETTELPAPAGSIADPQLAELCDEMLGSQEDATEASRGQSSRLKAAIRSYEQAMEEEFGQTHDHFRLVGQDNLRRYLPAGQVRLRIHPADNEFEVLARVAAARLAGCRVTVSAAPATRSAILERLESGTESWAAAIEFVEESDAELADAIRNGQIDRVRVAGRSRVPDLIWRAAAETGLHLATEPVLESGRVEVLWYLREQSLSVDYHRYGNLGARASEVRDEPQ